MICHNCHKYGHTKTGSRRKGVCRNCGEDDHTSDKTNKCQNESSYSNCGEGHMAGPNNCEVEIKDRAIKKCKPTAEWEDEELFKSWQEKMSVQDQTLNHTLHTWDAKWIQERKFNTWAVEKNFTREIGSKPATIRSNNETEFFIYEKESKIRPTLTSLCSPQFEEGIEVEKFACNKINKMQGLVYIHDYNISDIADCGSEL